MARKKSKKFRNFFGLNRTITFSNFVQMFFLIEFKSFNSQICASVGLCLSFIALDHNSWDIKLIKITVGTIAKNCNQMHSETILIACILNQRCGRTPAIRRIAVRETGISRYHGGPIEEFMGRPLFRTPLCRETPVFWIVDVIISSIA